MSPSQRFHLPSSLRKVHRTSPDTPLSASESDNGKIAKMLGSDAGSFFNTRSLSVATTAYETRRAGPDHFKDKLPNIAFSEATTESVVSIDLESHRPDRKRDLDRKPSSVLLGDGNHTGSYGSVSSQTKNLRNYGSSSTLHSHYESRSVPPSISQQTSESSARDRALRKGCTAVIAPDEGERDSLRPLESFKFSRSLRSKDKSQRSDRVDLSSLFPTPGSGRRPISKSEKGFTAQSKSLFSSPAKGATSTRKALVARSELSQKTVHLSEQRQEPLLIDGNPANFKVNVRRPKAGVKNWFDDNEDESSDEDVHGEPELLPNFVDGIESAFRDGSIRPKTAPEAANSSIAEPQTFLDSPAAYTLASSPSYFTKSMPVSPTDPAPRLTLNIPDLIAQAEDPVCFPVERRSLRHHKSRRFDDVDLHEQSVLCLSSSEDEEDKQDLPRRRRPPPHQTPIRDSLAVESILDVEIEIGTAQAVSKRAMSTPKPAKLKRVKGVLNPGRDSISAVRVPLRRSSRMQSYLSDQSANSSVDKLPVSSGFPLIPTEETWPSSNRSSIATRRESTRLMNVTKQEEILLAQMRLKRAEMNQDGIPNADAQNSDASKVLHQPRANPFGTTPAVLASLDHGLKRYSTMSDSTRVQESHGSEDYHQFGACNPRDSITTFQTNRASATTFQTNSTRYVDVEGTPSPTESHRSPATPPLLSERKSGSRNTGSGLNTRFTSASEEYHGHTRTRTDSSHIIVLDDLDKSPGRVTRSQHFIEWPYSGWDSMAGLAVH